MRCLAALARWEELNNFCKEYWTPAEPATRLEMAPMAANAAWNMGEWDQMAEYLLVRRGKVSESYERAYTNMVRVQQLSEQLEEVIDYCTLPLGNSVAEGRRALICNMWTERIQGAKRNVEVWQVLLAVRALVLPPTEDTDNWLKFASLCRQSGRISQASDQRELIENLSRSCTMFPNHQSNYDHDLVPQISSNPHQQDLVGIDTIDMVGGQTHNTIFCTRDNINYPQPQRHHDHHNNSEKKIFRRDNERQRRLHMTFLTASLRSLLPQELIQGKRSITDHMHEAVNYINYMKTKIEASRVRRDDLKSSCFLNSSITHQNIDCEISSNVQNCKSQNYNLLVNINNIIVRPCLGGILEIVISSHLPLSKVLQVLLQQGLSIEECYSTKVNGRLIHTLKSEVINRNYTAVILK
ncbi:hypothetical protein F8388_017422 [Cannabis sativa]|uniref:Uncharacterized protein n=1 Tax=Cannabis sativa TaxID=3483 RepID=A0A7J6H960_CANSA|nr:hypothetical protein F8388_017422 [Cannabis sativa]